MINEVVKFLNNNNYDIRLSHNARWIDQKCTPDVLWSISDFILNYIENVKDEFTVNDIWQSEYAKLTISETYSKPGTDEIDAENEYDKVFSQPLNLLSYAGVIKDISKTSRHKYKVINKNILEYIATNDLFSLRFLQAYIEKVLKDSNMLSWFLDFFENQDQSHFYDLKNKVINFYHNYTPIQGDFEPKRIFTKIINPLAHKYSKKGSKRGRMSKYIITKSDMMYNQDNFRDVYLGKPRNITRQEWLNQHPNIDLRLGYFEQMMSSAKRLLKSNINNYRNNLSELTQFIQNEKDTEVATQLHHIFPKNEFPEIMHYIENLIALTPNQHYGFAHPLNNTHCIDLSAQKILLIAKTYSIKFNLESKNENHIYDFSNLLHVLHIGWSDDSILEIEDGNFNEVLHAINYHYA